MIDVTTLDERGCMDALALAAKYSPEIEPEHRNEFDKTVLAIRKRLARIIWN